MFCPVGVLPGVATVAIGDVDGIGPHEGDRFAVPSHHRLVRIRVDEGHLGLLEGLDHGFGNVHDALGRLAVVEGGEGEAESFPYPWISEDDGDIVQDRALGVDDGPLVSRIF